MKHDGREINLKRRHTRHRTAVASQRHATRPVHQQTNAEMLCNCLFVQRSVLSVGSVGKLVLVEV